VSVRPGRGGVPPRAAPGSTEDALAVALAYYEAFNALDVEALRTLCAPDVVLTVEGGRLHGHDALIGYFADVHHHFPGIRTEVHVTALTPEHVVSENSFTVDSSATVPRGAEWRLDGRTCEILEIESGRITEVRNFYVHSGGDRIGEADVLRPTETYKLAQEQAALRRVAALVARDPTPDAVFAAVNREIGLIVAADATSLFRFHDDDTMTLVAVWSTDDATFPLGDRRPMNPPMLEMRRTGVGYRFDVLPEDASFLEEARAYGVQVTIAVPLLVEDSVWGVVFVTSRQPQAFPADTEDRVLRFTALAGIAIAHTRARANLAASRARLLAAADASRRQVQRDLHDGAQQRLMQTILGLKLARAAAAGHECAAATDIDEALHHAERAKAELHDLVRGVLPAVLTRLGLRAALESLVDDLPLEVALDVDARRLPVPVETAAYFVVAEALTNVVKHARVDCAAVRAVVDGNGAVQLEISDEGPGGADARGGTGLRGLADRVEAGGGSLEVDSPCGGGTRIRASIPVPPA
jgi:signal transduction histidine kinase/ketosteroid isomerase-like protein